MGARGFLSLLRAAGLSLALGLSWAGAAAGDVVFSVDGDKALTRALEGASLLLAAEAEGLTDPRDLVATARAEYERLLNTLYAQGYYGGVIRVSVDGVEAARIPTFRVPSRVGRIRVIADPGTQFHFGSTAIKPLVPGTSLPATLTTDEPARSTALRDGVKSVVDDWRSEGHAKASIRDQALTADHATHLLHAQVWIDPGPLVRFGQLLQTTRSAVRPERIAAIAGFPAGTTYSPEALDRVLKRLRRTGVFASVTATEADTLGAGNSMDVLLATEDRAPRRIGLGAEISSLEGLGASAYWLHRNLFGGAERFRVDGEVEGVTPGLGNLDATLDLRLDIPAYLGTDTDVFVTAGAAYLQEPTYRLAQGEVAVGVTRYLTDDLTVEAGLGYGYARVTDSQGARVFSIITLPTHLTWDRRDEPLDATRGVYVEAKLEPFADLNVGPGVWGHLDLRGYKGFGEGNRVVLAARVQAGTVLGTAVTQTHPALLFYSGGGGTVRGQAYQSLSFPVAGTTARIGGAAFVGGQIELRTKVREKIGIVGFFDVGYLGASGFLDPLNALHSGAGLGLRYDTGLGPIRLDLAYPVTGGTRARNPLRNAQLYVGIGQTF